MGFVHEVCVTDAGGAVCECTFPHFGHTYWLDASTTVLAATLVANIALAVISPAKATDSIRSILLPFSTNQELSFDESRWPNEKVARSWCSIRACPESQPINEPTKMQTLPIGRKGGVG